MTVTTPVPPPDDPTVSGGCVACRGPLGPSGRYCLACGARQGAARSDLLAFLVADGSAGAAEPAGPAAFERSSVGPGAGVGAGDREGVAGARPSAEPASVRSVGPQRARHAWLVTAGAIETIALLLGLVGGRLAADRTAAAPASTTAAPATGSPVR